MNSASNAGHPVDSIIIVRRRHDDDHGHHGGAWKIAYADFVTAMMCFFLVMWLINAANEKTKAQVASYFNPVKLTDASTSKKGLNEPTKVTSTSEKAEKVTAPGEQSEVKNQIPPEKEQYQAQFTEEQIFKNPYGILAQLAGQASDGAPPGHSKKGLAIVEIAEPGRRGGEAFRDPFDPFAWKSVPEPEKKAAAKEAAAEKVAKETTAGQEALPKQPAKIIAALPPKAPEAKTAPPSPIIKAPAKEPAAAPAMPAGEAKPAETKKETKPAEADTKTAIAVRQQLMQKMKQSAPDHNPTLEVKQTKEGILISLTDSLSFDMFAVGSAEPRPQLVVLMEKVAGTLRDYKGKFVIRGHTDSRPFRNADNDNWRLSTARAQMAYYMLVRAGVDENSVERIEGYADRDLKFPDEPESAGNRRIEILLKVDQP
ncbi:MAG: MotB family protein [Aestuariivirga sp.]|nr:MotB family protein [Aestuariivirga sp.]